ncbi:hypothetical protein MY10362_007668, partial [Beauveria mimosiformis]
MKESKTSALSGDRQPNLVMILKVNRMTPPTTHAIVECPGKMPLTAWRASLVTVGERWSYYVFLGPL